jgi:ABC-type glycerol-3-phosphate transport system permease component
VKALRKVSGHLALILACLGALFPVYWTVLSSFKTRVDIFAQPPTFWVSRATWENYAQVLADPAFIQAGLVTILVTLASTILATLAGALAAYGLVRRGRFKGRSSFDGVLILIRALPGIVLAVPLYKIVVTLGVYDNPATLIVVYAAINLPFAVWLMTGFVQGIPFELEEAARVDGASQAGILLRVVLPLIAPGLAATTIFVALMAWNEFLIPLVLADRQAKTLPVYVGGFVTSRVVNWGGMAAAASIAIIPIALLTTLVQRNLVRGLSSGAIKD